MSQTLRQGNPFLDPANQAALLDAYHSRVGIDYSYGGWLEDRSTVWSGTYLDETRSFTHLGVDLNAPTGTPIATDHHGSVIRIDDDHPEEGGWGPRILFRLRDAPIILIYAHLDRNPPVRLSITHKSLTPFASRRLKILESFESLVIHC